MLEARHVVDPYERAALEKWTVVPGNQYGQRLSGMPVLDAEGKLRYSAIAKAVVVNAACALVLCQVGRLFNAAVFASDAQSRCELCAKSSLPPLQWYTLCPRLM